MFLKFRNDFFVCVFLEYGGDFIYILLVGLALPPPRPRAVLPLLVGRMLNVFGQ